MALIVHLTFAQQKTVSGTVSDENGLPLIGATVIISGTSSGTTTDFDGKYLLNASTGDVLNFSYVGYESQNITVGASNTIDVALKPDNTLDEVVVTAFGITRNPKELGYAVSKVKTEDILENSEPDLIRSLAGKVPGVDVNFSNGVAGVYQDWYCVPYGYCFETEGNFTDVCNNLSGSWTEAFGCPVELIGMVNADRTLTISWSNCFGDTIEQAIYTPQ